MLIFSEPAGAGTCGDVDGNGQVTVTDGVNVLRAAAGLSSTCAGNTCDVDRSGAVTVTDGVNVLRTAAGLAAICRTGVFIGDLVKVVQGGRQDGAQPVVDPTQGTLNSNFPPSPDANAFGTITKLVGTTRALANRTIAYDLAFDTGATATALPDELPSLIVAARTQDGIIVPGFFELPLFATSASDAVAGITLAQDLGAEFVLKFATRFRGALSLFTEVNLIPAPLPGRTLSLVRVERDVFTRRGLIFAAISVSPDGRHLYLGTPSGSSPAGSALARFTRDPASGDVSFVERTNTFNFPTALSFSADGQDIYATTFPVAVEGYRRDPSTGSLHVLQQVSPPVADGLSFSIKVSPDGRNVYTLHQHEFSVAVFTRDASSGLLAFAGKSAIGGRIDGLNENGLAMSPDGQSFYAIAQVDFPRQSIVVLQRNPTTGFLTIIQTAPLATAGGGPFSSPFVLIAVTISPDGRYVYASSFNDDGIAVFARDQATGRLAFVDAYFDRLDGLDGLDGVDSLTVSPDGARLYASSGSRAFVGTTLAVFDRDQVTGRLTFVEAYFNQVAGVEGLIGGDTGLAVSPDSASVYLMSNPFDNEPLPDDAALTIFQHLP